MFINSVVKKYITKCLTMALFLGFPSSQVQACHNQSGQQRRRCHRRIPGHSGLLVRPAHGRHHGRHFGHCPQRRGCHRRLQSGVNTQAVSPSVAPSTANTQPRIPVQPVQFQLPPRGMNQNIQRACPRRHGQHRGQRPGNCQNRRLNCLPRLGCPRQRFRGHHAGVNSQLGTQNVVPVGHQQNTSVQQQIPHRESNLNAPPIPPRRGAMYQRALRQFLATNGNVRNQRDRKSVV